MKVAIIGAGVAGLTAADKLTRHNATVDVFDKARGTGGRISTKQSDMGNINIGAQYFTCRSDSFKQQVDTWQQNNVCARWEFTPHKAIDSELTPSPDKTHRFVGRGGMRALSRQLRDEIESQPALGNIYTQSLITRVSKENHLWTLLDENGQSHTGYDCVISTLPSEQAQALFAQIQQTIPTRVHAPCWSVTLATKNCENKAYIDEKIQGIFGEGNLSWVSRLSMQPGWQATGLTPPHDVWACHFNPDYSASAEKEYSRETLEQDALTWLCTYLNADLEVVGKYFHFWRYANLRKDFTASGPIIPQGENLIITGDWCFGGKIEGAFLAGLDAFNRAIR